MYDYHLAHRFQAWTFPALNPAGSVAVMAHALGIAEPEMFARVERLWQDTESFDQVRSDDFYAMLPINEYVAHVEISDRETWFDALAEVMDRGIADNAYGDTEHALEHIGGGGPDLVVHLDCNDPVRANDCVLDDQQDEGVGVRRTVEHGAHGSWPAPLSRSQGYMRSFLE